MAAYRAGTTAACSSVLRNTGHFRSFIAMSLDEIEFVCGHELRSSFTGMQASRGMPTQQNITDLMSWCTINGTCDRELLKSITGMQHGRGMPTHSEFLVLSQTA